MNPVIRGALRQTRIELRIQLFSPIVLGWLILPLITLGVLLSLQDNPVKGTGINGAQLGVPGLLVVNLLSSTVTALATQTVMDAEHGTLLRARTAPRALASHLMSTGLTMATTGLLPTYAMLVVAATLLDGVTPSSGLGWVLLITVTTLGAISTLPWGAMAGALLRTQGYTLLLMLLVYASFAISGIFYPISALPSWLQVVGQCLPTYWIGLGLRHALLPPEAMALEIDHSWRTGTMFLALGAWAVVGWLAAPAAVRRLTRRQSFTTVAAARDRVLARGY